MHLRFYPLDFDYTVENGQVLFHLYAKLETGEKICVVEPYQPYFFAKVSPADQMVVAEKLKSLSLTADGEPAKVISWEETEKELLGKKQQFWKIFVNYPKAVPFISRELESWGISCYEKDILFVHRYLRDKKIIPLTLVEADGEFASSSRLRVPVFRASCVQPVSQESLQRWKVLAVDIETYAKKKEIDMEKNPILMIGFYGRDENGAEFKKVITWKHFAHQLDYVQIVSDEVELLKEARKIILDYQPDIITGYYSDGFDFPYLKRRAEKYQVRFDLGADHSDLQISSRGSSEARIKGMLHLDMLKFIKYIIGGSLKTDSFTLDAVSQELLGHQKHAVDLDELAPLWDKNSDRLADFCAYNLHDAHLVHQLCTALLPDILEFTKIIGLPASDVIRMRFSRLVESYILKRAIEFNVLAPNKPAGAEMEQRREESVQGGFVYEPTPGLYQDIVVFDFRSLYPTIITAHNIGPEGFRCSCCPESQVPGLEQYWFCRKEKKFIPSVLEQLILVRADLKRLIKEAKGKKEDTKIIESRSYALKILANAFYGYLGFFGARWYCKECAAATTAYARNYIKSTIQKAEEKGFKVMYGDSLTPERKIFIRDKEGEVHLLPIGEFVDKNLDNPNIRGCHTLAFDGTHLIFSPLHRVIRHDYDSTAKGELLKIITTQGSTRVTPQHSLYAYENGLIKPTHAGSLQEGDFLCSLTTTPVIEKYRAGHRFDISQLSFEGMDEELWLYTDTLEFPARKGTCPYCSKNTRLAQHVFQRHQDRRMKKQSAVPSRYGWLGTAHGEGGRIPRSWLLTTELAWILGFYCAEGSATDLRTKSGSRKCMISFGSQDRAIIERVKNYFDAVLGDDLKIIVSLDKRIDKEMFYYRVQRIPLVGLFVSGFGCGKGSSGKKVPSFIYSSEEKIRRAFLEGYLVGDGNSTKDQRYRTHFIRFDTNSKDLACGLDYLLKSVEQGKTHFGMSIKHVGWRYRTDKPLISSLRVQGAKHRSLEHGNVCAARIKKIKKEPYAGPVYDLEVSPYHNFVDAEGLLLVHNTDSMFMLLGDKILDQALEFMNEINFDLPGHMELECEGYYPQGIFVALKGREGGAKKKYALMNKDGKLKITGFETVRRNWSPLAKNVQKEVLKLILENKKEEALAFLRSIIQELKEGKIPLEQLILKTQITREISAYSSVAPHVFVAKKLLEKGETVVPGTVVQYIIGSGSGLVRERAVLPEDVKEGKYDADYYLHHQLLPAVSSVFAVLGYTEDDLLGKSKQTGLGKFM